MVATRHFRGRTDSARGAHGRRAAFTLVEIMVVVTIVGLVAALVLPSFYKARKVSQARRVINDAKMLDAAVTQWAQEKDKKDGDAVNLTEASSYLKSGHNWWVDILGNPYGVGPVGNNQIQVSWRTKSYLAGVGVDWGLY